ncbi:MAG: filamentous hemagglutinin N-terminal domain-containing protein [Simkaniaceae bacterium]|nr:MAG: filamentous hemagglutinin N-terminal domain-containing protein [Simkaniaceae bacterium]
MSKHSLFALTLLPIALMAKPSGPDVVQGDATFAHPTKHTMQIVTGDQTIINWDEFSIDPAETTQFIQPSHSSAVLNRVVTGTESHIMGSLLANGKVFLVNPNGILIGPDATIDTYGFIASTLDVLDSEFMKGSDLRFRGNSDGKVVNLGKVQAWDGDIALIGRYIENHGELYASKGMVSLAAGKEVLLKPNGEERVFICALSENATKKGTGITNSGKIEALKIRLLADGNPYKLAINHEGKIDATKVEQRNGEIFLVAENGVVEVHGQIAADKGEIRILGETVVLHDGSVVDASCNFGAGRVLIGGSFQGKDPHILNSKYTFIHSGATVNVNSYQEGNGGVAVIWSDGATHFHGLVQASGGELRGNGGTVEISGKRFLDISGGEAKRPAPAGTPGKLLLDPNDVMISDGVTSGISFFAPMTYTPTGPISILSVYDLIKLLNSGPVEVTTNSAYGGNGDIIIATNMDSSIGLGYATEHDFTLSSHRDLIIQASVQNSGSGNIVCNVGRDLRMDGSDTGISRLGSQLGNVSIQTGRHVLMVGGTAGQAHIGFDNPSMESNIHMTVGGDIVLQSVNNFALIGHTNTTGMAPTTFKGNITIDSVGGDILLSTLDSNNMFAQIGIASDQKNTDSSGPTQVVGNIDVRNVKGSLRLIGGTGGTGAYTLIGHGGRARSFVDQYQGDISVKTTGDISILGGSDSLGEKFAGIGFAQEFATKSTHYFTSNSVSVESGKTIYLQSGQGSNPAFIGAFTGNQKGTVHVDIGTIHVKSGGMLSLLGNTYENANADSVIGVTGSNGSGHCSIDIIAGKGLQLLGSTLPNGTSNVAIQNGPESGLIDGSINIAVLHGNATLKGGVNKPSATSHAFVRSNGDLNVNILSGNLDLVASDPAYLISKGIAKIYASGDITLTGGGCDDSAYISHTGLLSVKAGQHLKLFKNSFIENKNGVLTVIAGNNLELSSLSSISNLSNNPINIVVDHSSPKHPDYGNGALIMAEGSKIHGTGPIQIYTSRQELNQIHGMIGGALFTPGSLFVPQAPEKWLSRYSNSFYHSDSPFTIHYKDGVLSPQRIERSQVVISEMLTGLHPYDEYLGWLLEFQTAYATLESMKIDQRATSSFQVIPDQLHYLRMKKNFDHNSKITHFVTFPKTLNTGK